ncbi:hypothetical protein ACFSM7_02520 [Clavibacter michiganensis subsp. tessellarius]
MTKRETGPATLIEPWIPRASSYRMIASIAGRGRPGGAGAATPASRPQ